MDSYHVFSIIITLTAVASYVNYRYIRLPQPIGVTLITILLSLVIIMISHFGFDIKSKADVIINQIDLSETILNGMLSFLLFAGSLHVNSLELAKYRQIIGTLATISVLISTFIIGVLVFFASQLLNVNLPFIYCLLFGALISPTDPIAVLSILKNIKSPKSLQLKIAGEALFNDGMGIVMFLVLLGVATGKQTDITMVVAIKEFLKQMLGAIVLGYALGHITAHYMCRVANFEVSALMTLALVSGGYTLAHSVFHVSGPVTMVIAGLVIGHRMRAGHMSDMTIARLDAFWALVDEVLNSILFVLIGLEVLNYNYITSSFSLTLCAIVIVIVARFLSIYIPVRSVRIFRRISRFTGVLTWAGLRGGVSIALALSLPDSEYKDLIITITYGVVIFSIIVQGLTVEKLVRITMNRLSLHE